MQRSMTRWVLAGAMALAELSAVTVLDAASTTALAAPSASQFAGTWSGTFSVADSADPEFHRAGTFDWTISDQGRITGTFFHTTEPLGGPFWFVGAVREDGALLVVMHIEGGGVPHEGTVAIDAQGNLVASATDRFSPRHHTWTLVATRESE